MKAIRMYPCQADRFLRWGRYALLVFGLFLSGGTAFAGPAVDLSGQDPSSAIAVTTDGEGLSVHWQISPGTTAHAQLALVEGERILRSLSIEEEGGASKTVLRDVAPVFHLNIGKRNLAKNGWTVFFDKVDQTPVASGELRLALNGARVESNRTRATVKFGTLSFGSFEGELWFTFYEGSALIHVEAVIATGEDARAFTYSAALAMAADSVEHLVYHAAGGEIEELPMASVPARPSQAFLKQKNLRASPLLYGKPDEGYLKVKNRALVAQLPSGAVAVFPTPHKFYYPLDYADNFGFNTAWTTGGDAGGKVLELGFKQSPHGDGRFRPWVNAPPGTEQHLDLFLLVSSDRARDALAEVKAFTHDDTYPSVAGHQRFTSHYHLRHARYFINAQEEEKTDGVPASMIDPEFVKKFKETGVDIVHLAEFHGGPKPVRSRLEELKVLHDECARLSGEDFLLIPGEEPNVHLDGHWISFFPKPVYWELKRKPGEPFVEEIDGYGTVYRVGSVDDIQEMMERENGLMWTAHPRIKGSTGCPDRYQGAQIFKSESFLGAAWKAMPADFSRERLGDRVLDLLDDMNQWGERKLIVGEADLFELYPDSELYGHLNMNYLELDVIPDFGDGWQPVRDVLKAGRFFTSTGEVLIPQHRFERQDDGAFVLEAGLRWTFPMQFAEIVSGDGEKIYRDRIDLSDTVAFGEMTLRKEIDLAGRKWVRFEAWDVAENGAFTQPLRIDSSGVEPFSIVSMTLDNEALHRAHDVELQGDLAFVPGKGGSTAIIDVSVPEKPVILWSLRDEEETPDSETVLPAGDHLLLGTRNFHVLDISRPKKTKLLKTISDLPRLDKINGMVLVGDVVIAACKSGYVSAFDVSDRAAPEVFGFFETKKALGLDKPHDIDRYGDYLVIVDPQGFAPPLGKLGVIRAIEGEAVLPVEEWELVGSTEGERLIGANRVQVVGDYAFVGGSCMPEARAAGALPMFSVIDLSDPEKPEVVAALPFRSDRGPNGLTVAGEVVFCAGGQRVEAYDVSDPLVPKHLGGQSFPIYQEAAKTDNYHDLIYRDGYLYISAQCDNGFLVLKVDDGRIRELADGAP